MSPSGPQETQGLLSPFLARRRYKQAAKFVTSTDTVLDLGCGSGALRKYLPSGAEYYGTDLARYWDHDDGHLFVVKVGEPLPGELQSKRVSVVTALALIEHLSKPEQLFVEACRVLAPGGRFVLTTPHPLGRKVHDIGGKLGVFSSHASEEHESFLGKSELLKLANQTGFELIKYKRFLLGVNQVAVFRK